MLWLTKTFLEIVSEHITQHNQLESFYVTSNNSW